MLDVLDSRNSVVSKGRPLNPRNVKESETGVLFGLLESLPWASYLTSCSFNVLIYKMG